jgi:hypothetical protein
MFGPVCFVGCSCIDICYSQSHSVFVALMSCHLVQYESLTVLLLLWWGTLLAAAQYRTALTPTDYRGGVEVELHPSHMTTEAGLDWLGV